MKRSRLQKPKSLEKDILRTILEYLQYRKVFCWRNNTGTFMRGDHFYRFGSLGSPDIFAVKDGKIYGIEVKTGAGKQSESQLAFQKNLEEAGGIYFISRSIEDVQKYGL